MHSDFCVRQHIVTSKGGDCWEGTDAQDFLGLAHAQAAVSRVLEAEVAAHAEAVDDWTDWSWFALVAVYYGSVPHPDNEAIRFELCRRRYDGGAKPTFVLESDRQYLCLGSNHDHKWFTDHGPGGYVEALRAVEPDSWAPHLLACNGRGLEYTWLDLFTGRLTTRALQLFAAGVGA